MNDYYRLLKVAPQASSNEIRKAFRQEAKRCHPDLYHSASPEEKKKLQKQFVLLTQAYETLSAPNRRREYDLKFQQYSAKKQKPQANASSSSNRTHRRPESPPFTRTRRHTPEPPPFAEAMDETLEDLLAEVEGLMGKFGVQFRDPLDILVGWALKVFQEFTAAWKEEDSEPSQQQRHPKPEKKYSMFAEIEEEFQKLKAQQSQGNTKKRPDAGTRAQPSSQPEIDRELKELKKKYGKSP